MTGRCWLSTTCLTQQAGGWFPCPADSRAHQVGGWGGACTHREGFSPWAGHIPTPGTCRHHLREPSCLGLSTLLDPQSTLCLTLGYPLPPNAPWGSPCLTLHPGISPHASPWGTPPAPATPWGNPMPHPVDPSCPHLTQGTPPAPPHPGEPPGPPLGPGAIAGKAAISPQRTPRWDRQCTRNPSPESPP